MDSVFFSKTHPNAIIPTKRDEDAGFDFYACFDSGDLILRPGQIVIVPTGIATAFTSDMVLFIKERSSTGAVGLALRMGVVDSGYRGELLIALNNTTEKLITITKEVDHIVKNDKTVKYPYSKAIAQGVFLFLPRIVSTEISYEELLNIKSERMLNKMGESGK